MGGQFVESGAHKRVVVIGADKMSSIVDYTDRSTCVLFGDGAGAVLIEPGEDSEGIQDFIFQMDGAGGKYLSQPGGGSLHPASHETVDKKMHYVRQDGREVFRFATNSMASVSSALLERNGLTGEDIALFLPHQANKRIIDACVRKLNFPEDKVLIDIDRHANTTCGTIPIALSVAVEEGRLSRGDQVVLTSAGAGFTWGSALMKWAY